jgi:uncharacterized protein (TIGR00730 family)
VKTICINLGSNPGNDRLYVENTIILAKTLVYNDYRVVYGGADVGLMGVLANTIIKHKGQIIGVIPRDIAGKVGHKNLDRLIVVNTLHERKQKMFELSDAFIALPGGYGTLEEIFEILTWAQLGYHNKPMGFFTIKNYYTKLEEFLDNAVTEGFIKKEHRNMIVFEKDADELIKKMKEIKVPLVSKWMDRV